MDFKKKRKKASKWDEISERALLAIWGEKMSELRGCRKNNYILVEMALELNALGYKYTVFELKTKMHNMSARYRKEKQKIGTAPVEWDLYKEMHMLLGPYKSYQSEDLVVDSINDINSSISPLPSPSIVVPSSPLSSPTRPDFSPSPAPSSIASISKNEGLEQFLINMEKGMEKMQDDIKNMSERLIAIEEEKKEILKAYVEREAEVQKELIAFLKRT